MNSTNFWHALIAVCIQLSVGLPCGHLWIGGLVAVAFYWGREMAQAEIALKAQTGQSIESMGWSRVWPWTWSVDGQLDLYCPMITTGLIALGGYYVGY